MIFRYKSQRIMLIMVICTLVATSIVANYSVRYMQERFHRYDEQVFERIVEAAADTEPSMLFMNIDSYINEGDILISVNASDSVILSEGLVTGEQYKELVHEKVNVSNGRIKLNRGEFDLNTYISNVNVRIDKVFTFELSDGTRCYYIPYRLVGEKDYLMLILASITIGCFSLAIAMAFINKDITEIMKEEKLV